MKKASEYRQHAEECRRLGKSMDGAQRAQLLELAQAGEHHEERSFKHRG